MENDLMENDVAIDDRTHDYKGFTIEQVIGGYVIVAYCRKHNLYLSGDKGSELSDNPRNAKTFRTVEYCHRLIDKFIENYVNWINSL